MKSDRNGNHNIIYVERGEKVMKTLTAYCTDNGIHNGKVSGIGAVKDIEIGAFDVSQKGYVRKNIEEIMELVSFQGNITLKDDQPFIHAHATLGTHDLDIKGGHMFECTVAVVGEFIITELDTGITRKLDESIGLATLCKE